ncbi:hypothetical protein R1flu_020908 [Riccia fluitans]|uniref:Uncharacterized protein n=1 Tax=Riccia fluitans TaxID=41844 RepID=A0ABD1ZN68_9MARC
MSMMAWSRRAAPLLLRSVRGYQRSTVPALVVGSLQVNAAHLVDPSSSVFTPCTNVLAPTNLWSGVRRMSSDIAKIPKLSDPAADEALHLLLATEWAELSQGVKDSVEAALAKSNDATLSTVWTSAQAVEKFAGTLESLRMEFGELNGANGETVRKVPDSLLKALDAVFKKYRNYLASFVEDEDFLKKKVQNDLGAILLQIKQRCTGLGPEWGEVSLLGTSGLSGSYIERRSKYEGA